MPLYLLKTLNTHLKLPNVFFHNVIIILPSGIVVCAAHLMCNPSKRKTKTIMSGKC